MSRHQEDRNDLSEIRNSRQTEDLLRQFLNHDGPKGANGKYKRGWRFNFEFNDEERAAVNEQMASGASFEDAFDLVDAARLK